MIRDIPVAEASVDIKEQRAAFHRGFVALKLYLRSLVEAQVEEHRALGLPRKTAEDCAALQVALSATQAGKRYPNVRAEVSYVQMRVELRKVDITAALIVHAEVRGKAAPHKIDKYDKGQYNVCRARAEQIFKEAACKV